jgi:hypothetical protein
MKIRATIRGLRNQMGHLSYSHLTAFIMTKKVDSPYILESQTNYEAARQVCHLHKYFVTVSDIKDWPYIDRS